MRMRYMHLSVLVHGDDELVKRWDDSATLLLCNNGKKRRLVAEDKVDGNPDRLHGDPKSSRIQLDSSTIIMRGLA